MSTAHDNLRRALLPGCAITACSAGVSAILRGAAERSDAAFAVPLLAVWGAIALAAAWWAREERVPLWAIVLVGALARLPLLGSPPLLSDDLYRYLWEGLALNHGHDPFRSAPLDIPGLDDALRARVNHGDLPSIYPPVALTWFRVLAALGTAPWIAQSATAATDLLVTASIARIVRGRTVAGRPGPTWPALLYALHPLPAVESAQGAHLDVLAVWFAVLAVGAWSRRDAPAAVLAAILGAGTKLLPGLLLPALVRRAGPTPRLALAALTGGLVVLALGAPVLGAGAALWTSWVTYSRHWAFNGFLHPWLHAWLGDLARPLLLAAGALVVASTWARNADPARAWLAVGSGFVLLSPTAHPWYVLWPLVPSLLLGRWGWSVAAIFLLGDYLVLATYDPTTASWSEPDWLWWVTWPPAVAGLLLELALASRGGWPPDAPTGTLSELNGA